VRVKRFNLLVLYGVISDLYINSGVPSTIKNSCGSAARSAPSQRIFPLPVVFFPTHTSVMGLNALKQDGRISKRHHIYQASSWWLNLTLRIGLYGILSVASIGITLLVCYGKKIQSKPFIAKLNLLPQYSLWLAAFPCHPACLRSSSSDSRTPRLSPRFESATLVSSHRLFAVTAKRK
jgi:hypothetical protein